MEHEAPSPVVDVPVLLEKDSDGAADPYPAPLLSQKTQLLAADESAPVVRLQKGRRKKAGDDTLPSSFCAWIEQHQFGLSINLLLLLTLTHICFPRARRRTRKFLELAYYDAASGTYTQGWDDFAFVGFWIVAFTALRAATMDYVLKPLARKGGVQKKKACVRFAEQGWLLIYYTASCALGTYIYYHSAYWLSIEGLWNHYPIRNMSALFKWYYLVQFAFWLQQIFVINMEARRKDHWQMFAHHIITSALVSLSYGSYQTKAGNVILCLMDAVDIFLAGAKLLKYLGYQTACDIAFGAFIISWIVARHGFYVVIAYSLYAVAPVVIPYGCYDSVTAARLADPPTSLAPGGTEIWRNLLQTFIDPGGPVCFNTRVQWSFLSLLIGLQVIMLFWMWMIVKVVYRVLRGKGADDSRSDDEVEEEEEQEMPQNDKDGDDFRREMERGEKSALKLPQQQPLEEEVGVEGLHFKGTPKRRSERLSYKRSTSRSSGISIAGHVDRKELLGRIGCDKPA